MKGGSTAMSVEHKPLPSVTILVPAFNEERVLDRNLIRLVQYLKSIESLYSWEILIVDDGSTDRTGEIAEAFAAAHPNIRVLHHMFNFRLGQALRFGFHNTWSDIIVVLDADLSYAPEHIGAMLERMRTTRARIVIASPYRKGGRLVHVPVFRRLLSRWANRFLCLMASKDFFSDKLTNITGMVRAYDGDFIRHLSLWSMDVDINAEIINKAKILRARIAEVPAVLDWSAAKPTGRRHGTGRFHLSKTVVQSLVSGFMFRPFLFFISPGLVLFFLSLYPLAWTLIHTLRAYSRLASAGLSLDYRISEAVGEAFRLAPHAFIVGGMALLVAIQLISLGLLALQKKRYFVELFYLGSLLCCNSPGGVDPILPGDPLRKG
jgi:glycosyltransferase involved in cell wall biosynthesis